MAGEKERLYMPSADNTKWERLADFEARPLTFHGEEKRVFASGKGPAIILMSEIPGITWEQARFARWVRDAGFTLYMPDLFGDAGRPISMGYVVSSVVRTCIAREFAAFAANKSSPVTQWLRALAAHAHAESGGKGVGALGMCFTGNFALTMMLERRRPPHRAGRTCGRQSPPRSGRPDGESLPLRRRSLLPRRQVR